MADIASVAQAENRYWNQRYASERLEPVSVEAVEMLCYRPSYAGGDYSSENKIAFRDLIRKHGGWEDKLVLDYACGVGRWAMYFALTGAKKVVGFDFSEVGVQRGRERVQQQGLEGKVELHVMDAANLTFPSNEFDLVIGHGALHHTMKYPGTLEHLHRVIKPGGKAFFIENLSDFFVWKLWWWAKGAVEEGDIPIFADAFRENTKAFRECEIIGDTFVHSLRVVLNSNKSGTEGSAWRRALLRATHRTDEALFRAVPALRRWGSMCMIALTK